MSIKGTTKISIHSTTRVETTPYHPRQGNQSISIHSTTRVETSSGLSAVGYLVISIHSTTRVETGAGPASRHTMNNFNPLHHEGGDAGLAILSPSFWAISIHSTTRVETWLIGSRGQKLQISIHSTTRVETESFVQIYHPLSYFNPLHHEGGDGGLHFEPMRKDRFQSTPPRGWRQQYYTITTTILQHISTNKSYPTPSNHGQPSLYTRKSVLIVQIFRCESPRKSMFASGSHQNTLYRFTARGQVRISAVLPH